MTVESATARQPYTSADVHRYQIDGTCATCGQLWPCQSALALANSLHDRTMPYYVSYRDNALYENLMAEHFEVHPDHEKALQPEACPACASIAAYRDTVIRMPGAMPVVSCSECGLPLANEDLLAEHQVTVHNMTAETEKDAVSNQDAPLEDRLYTG